MGDFGLSLIQAAGIVGNLGHESGGFKQMQEKGPVSGRGGFGWAQWTGPRRKAFEAWAAENKLDIKSDEANYGYLKKELQSSEKASIASVKKATTLEEAVKLFELKFERAGVKHYESRNKYAKTALDSYTKNGGGSSSSPTGTESGPPATGTAATGTGTSATGTATGTETSATSTGMSSLSSALGSITAPQRISGSGTSGVTSPMGVASAFSGSNNSGGISVGSNYTSNKTPSVSMTSTNNEDTKSIIQSNNMDKSGASIVSGFNDKMSDSGTSNSTGSNSSTGNTPQAFGSNSTSSDSKMDLGPTKTDAGSIDYILDKLFSATGQSIMFAALTQATGQMPLGLDNGRS